MLKKKGHKIPEGDIYIPEASALPPWLSKPSPQLQICGGTPGNNQRWPRSPPFGNLEDQDQIITKM